MFGGSLESIAVSGTTKGLRSQFPLTLQGHFGTPLASRLKPMTPTVYLLDETPIGSGLGGRVMDVSLVGVMV